LKKKKNRRNKRTSEEIFGFCPGTFPRGGLLMGTSIIRTPEATRGQKGSQWSSTSASGKTPPAGGPRRGEKQGGRVKKKEAS